MLNTQHAPIPHSFICFICDNFLRRSINKIEWCDLSQIEVLLQWWTSISDFLMDITVKRFFGSKFPATPSETTWWYQWWCSYHLQVRKSMCRIKHVLTERAIAEPDPRRSAEMKRMINALWCFPSDKFFSPFSWEWLWNIVLVVCVDTLTVLWLYDMLGSFGL